jgi:hypothetical protein
MPQKEEDMSDPFENEGTPNADPASTRFFEGGSPSCQFKNVGDFHQGTILKFEEAQQRDITTQELAFWSDGNKKEMLVITLQTTEHSDNIDDDDGTRRLYVNKPSGMYIAIAAAIKASKQKFVVGGWLAVKFTQLGVAKIKSHNPPKEYAAKYSVSAAVHPTSDTSATYARGIAVKAFIGKNPTTKDNAKLKDRFNILVGRQFVGIPESVITADQWSGLAADIEMGDYRESTNEILPSSQPTLGNDEPDVPF